MIYKISDTGEIKDRKGAMVVLEPRLAKLYNSLYNKANQVVSREELTNNVWQETIVNEDALTRAISDLRRELNKNLTSPPTIITEPKRGYRLKFPTPSPGKRKWVQYLKYASYVIGGFIIFILVIRGLNY